MTKRIKAGMNTFAKRNGYEDLCELLMDYGFIPTVLMPKHKKMDIFKLIIKRKRGGL